MTNCCENCEAADTGAIAAPIVCTPELIPPGRRAEHRRRLAELVMARALHAHADGEGFILAYRAEDFLELAKWVDLERLCCSFASFELRADGNGVALRIAGPAGTAEYLSSLISEPSVAERAQRPAPGPSINDL